MKYCVVDIQSNTKVSRFFKTEKQAQLRVRSSNHIVMSKQTVKEKGIFVESKTRKVIKTYIPIELVKGVFMNDKYKIPYANKVNTENYKKFCIANGFAVPI